MMTTYRTTIGRRNDDWDIVLTTGSTAESITFTELLYNPTQDVTLTGRTLTVENTPAFQKAIAAGGGNLEEFLQKNNEDGRLNIDFLYRMCERHMLTNDLSGDKLATVYRYYLKHLRDTEHERMARGASLYARAFAGILAIDRDNNKIIDMMSEAISLGFTPAYEALTVLYYRIVKNPEKAIEIAKRGVKAGCPECMNDLAYILTECHRHRLSPDFNGKDDYKLAAELCMAAAAKGEVKDAVRIISRLINNGLYTPAENAYMKIICMAAKANRQKKETNLDAVEAYMKRGLYCKAVQLALAGVEAGNPRCLYHVARLYGLGADFTGQHNRLGTPDYENAVRWCVKSIEAGEMEARGLLDSYFNNNIRINYTL